LEHRRTRDTGIASLFNDLADRWKTVSHPDQQRTASHNDTLDFVLHCRPAEKARGDDNIAARSEFPSSARERFDLMLLR
jgi:hypothetical protein